MIIIAAALKAELQPFIEHLKAEKTILVGKSALRFAGDFHLLRLGKGAQSAGTALSAYLEQYRPQRLFLIGMAGALDSEIEVGTVFTVKRVVDEQTKQNILLANESPDAVGLLTVRNAVVNVKQREHLYRQFGTELVDMESFTIARICQERRVPLHIVRCVSDVAGQTVLSEVKKRAPVFAGRLFATVFPLLKPEK